MGGWQPVGEAHVFPAVEYRCWKGITDSMISKTIEIVLQGKMFLSTTKVGKTETQTYFFVFIGRIYHKLKWLL